MLTPHMIRPRLATLLVTGLALSACNESAGTTEPLASLHEHHAVAARAPIASAGNTLIKQVHSISARFHSTVQAEKAGYAATDECVAVPVLGGMGFHYVNGPLVDPLFDPLNPEVMLYAPDKHGNLKLVAVEYIVVDVGQDDPTFDGQPFDVGGAPPLGATPHWTLHVWLNEPNPSGTFAPFNPNVSCN